MRSLVTVYCYKQKCKLAQFNLAHPVYIQFASSSSVT